LEDDGASVGVRFKNGEHDRFDIVVGADGRHSNTCALMLGPEESFNRYLGSCFNVFSFPNYGGLSHEGITYAEPGRTAGVYAVGDSETLHAFLIFAADQAPFLSHPDIDNS
jgi:2-polyprenyl-6-methoxyphenol hydroxylase-like FAD-dependent oxidoreductase